MRWSRWFILMAIAGLGAGCAGPVSNLPPLPKDAVAAELRKQQIAQIRKYYRELRRVDSVAFRIRTANANFCNRRVSAQIGLYAATPRSLPRTSSGKLSRAKARNLYLSGDIKPYPIAA